MGQHQRGKEEYYPDRNNGEDVPLDNQDNGGEKRRIWESYLCKLFCRLPQKVKTAPMYINYVVPSQLEP